MEHRPKADVPDQQDTTNKAPTLRRPGQSVTAMEPLRRPPDDADEATWAAYRKERRRRKIVKAARRARIARRETPHDTQACKVCQSTQRRGDGYVGLRVVEIAHRAMVSESTAYRVLSDNPKQARGRKTLATLRRIAHDGMGVSLDELAAIVLD